MAVDLALLKQLSEDRALASEIIFAHRHPQATPDFHIQIVDLWRAADELVLVECYRGAGKTTKGEEHVILEACYGNFAYLLLIAETYEKACERIDAMNTEACRNVKLHQVFGGKVLARKSNENRIWFKSGAFIEAWGWDQELQSFKHNDRRPDMAWLVDIENSERTRDSAAVDAGMRKFWLELMPALDTTKRKVRFEQTRRAQDCMTTRFAANPEFVHLALPICDGDIDDPRTKSNWPERHPMEWIRAERDRYRKAGELASFLQMYMLQAVNPEARPFKEEMLGAMDVSPWHWMPKYVIYDPSRTTNERRSKTKAKSDRTGKVVVSRMGSKILVHESSGRFWKPDEFIGDVFAANDTHQPVKIGIEKNALDDWLLQPIRIESLRRGATVPVRALQAPQDRSKEDFIMGLQPFALAGDITLVGGKTAHPDLVQEWINWPQGSRDVLNALAYSLRMFGGTPVYEDFSGANIGDAPTPRMGETVYVGAAAAGSEVALVAVVREGRRLCVAADWTGTGSLSDVVKTLVFELRATFPRASIQAWVPAETHDQYQRIPLVPALRAEKITAYRAEHVSIARGCLSDRIRNVWRSHRLLTVDLKAKNTLNALGAGYAYPAEKGGRQGSIPEEGVSRLIAEALECMVAMLDRQEDAGIGIPKGANVAHTPGGAAYVSSNPRLT